MYKLMRFILVICLACLAACGRANTYVLFAQNAKDDSAMDHAITLRLPLKDQPVGATVSCLAGKTRTAATRLDDCRIKVQDLDGEERVIDTPCDGNHIGLITYWPNNRAEKCGIDPQSPVGTKIVVLWGEFEMTLSRVDRDKQAVGFGKESFEISCPLAPADREALKRRGVPDEIASLLY